MKTSRAYLVSILILVLLAIAGWRLRIHFLQNHVVFLLNQHRITEAGKLADQLFKTNPEDLTNKFHRLKIAAISGDDNRVAEGSGLPELKQRFPETLYWLALAEYHAGHNDLSKSLAQEFVTSHARLPDAASVKIATALTGQPVDLLDEPEVSEPSYRLLFDLEKGVYLGLTAERHLASGYFSEATRVFNHAFDYGFRSEAFMLEGARAAALAGLYQKADLFQAYAGSSSAEVLYSEFRSDYEANKGITPMVSLGGNREGKLEFAQGVTWAAYHYAQGNLQDRGERLLNYVSGLQQVYPYDLVMQMRLAELMTLTNHLPEASSLYEAIADETGSIQAELRNWNLKGLTDSQTVEKFNQVLPQSLTVYKDVLVTTESTSVQFSPVGQKSVSGTLAIEKQGRYMVSIVARAQAHDYKWPVVRVKIGHVTSEYFYVNRNGWDCYSAFVLLDKGQYPFQITAASKDGSPLADSAGLELMSFFVTDAGVE